MNSEQLGKIAVLIVIGCLLLYIVQEYNNRCKLRDQEAFYESMSNRNQVVMPNDSGNVAEYKSVVDPSSAHKHDAVRNKHKGNPDNVQPTDCYPRDRLTADDLLPKDAANSKWAQVNPAGQGDVKDQNFLTAGYLTGINTVGSSLRNANYQLRSDPPNPQLNVSPWNQTTIEPDLNHRPLEIGGDF